MAIIANLDIILGAQTAGAERALRGSIRMMDGLVAKVKAVAAGYLSIEAARRLVDASNIRSQDIDALSEQAELLKTNYNALASLQLQAKLAGDDFESLTGAIARTTRFVGDAANGSEKATKALQDLGLSISDLQGADSIERVFMIGQALSQIEESTLAASAANSVFGKQWQGVMRTVLQGTEGLAAAREQFRARGLEITDAMLKINAEANDQLDFMNAKWDSIIAKTLGYRAAAVGMLDDTITLTEAGAADPLAFLFNWEKLEQQIDDTAAAIENADQKAKELSKPEKAEAIKAAADAAEEAKEKEKSLHDTLMERGRALSDSLRTPIEEFRDDLAELIKLAESGAISREVARRAVDAGIARIRQAADSAGFGINPGLAARGSADALTPFLRRQSTESPVQKQILVATQDGNDTLERIEKILSKPNVAVAEVEL